MIREREKVATCFRAGICYKCGGRLKKIFLSHDIETGDLDSFLDGRAHIQITRCISCNEKTEIEEIHRLGVDDLSHIGE